MIFALSASKLPYSPSSNSPTPKSRPASLVSPTGSFTPSASRQAAPKKSRSGTADIESVVPHRWSVTPTPATPLPVAFAPNSTSNIITEESGDDENDPVADLTDQFVNRRMTRSASRGHSEPPSISRTPGSRGSSVSAVSVRGSDIAWLGGETPHGTRSSSRASSSGRVPRV